MDDISRELKAFLDYVAGKWSEDSFVIKLEKAVKKAKKNRKWRHEYMALSVRDQDNLEKGRKENMKAVAIRMLTAGKYTLDEIVTISGLSLKDVEKLKAKKAI